MELISTSKQERLAEVQDLYSNASVVQSKQADKFKEFDSQYRGDKTIDGLGEDGEGARQADIVYNISFELLEGSIDTDIPQPFVTPEFKCEHNVRNARRIENLIRMLMDKQPFEKYNDTQERTTKKFGISVTNVEWDVDTGTYTTVGEAQVSPVRPANVYPQPGITDIDDCDYIFVDYLTTRAELMRKYSLKPEDLDETALLVNDDSEAVGDAAGIDEVVTLTVMWYRNDRGDVCRFAYSGDLVLEDDDDYYSRKVEYCRTCGRRRQLCESSDDCSDPDYYMNKLDYDELTEDIECSDGRIIPAMSPVFKNGKMQFETVKMPVTAPDGSQLMDDVAGVQLPAFVEVQVPKMRPTRLPYYKPRKLPIAIRYNIKDDDSFWGISDMEIIREEQQECNKLTSRIHEAVMKSGAALLMPENLEMELSNGVFDNIIPLGEGVDKNQFAMFSYAVDIQQWVAERAAHKDQAKRLLGISDSFLGQADNTAKSGYAKSIQVSQSAGRLASKKVMKQAHYADIFRIIFELYLAFADEPRRIHHDDVDCLAAASERFDRSDFYEFDPKTGKWYIDDNYAFSVDANGSFEQQYPQLWEIVKADYAQGMYGDPSQLDTQIIAWQHLEKLRYPFAKNIVEMKKQQKEQMMQAQTPRGMGDVPGNKGAQGVPMGDGAPAQVAVNEMGGLM